MNHNVRVTRWSAPQAPTESELRQLMARDGLDPYRWSNGPGEVYPAHAHGYDKIIYVVHGAITFGLPDSGDAVPLGPGDRLDLPAGTAHDALVGGRGVVCLEAHS